MVSCCVISVWPVVVVWALLFTGCCDVLDVFVVTRCNIIGGGVEVGSSVPSLGVEFSCFLRNLEIFEFEEIFETIGPLEIFEISFLKSLVVLLTVKFATSLFCAELGVLPPSVLLGLQGGGGVCVCTPVQDRSVH